MEQYKLCFEIAKQEHSDQIRTITRELYINHPLRISKKFENETLKCISILHDVLEDTDITEKELIEKGVNKDIIVVVKILTRKKGETYFNYIRRLSKNKIAIEVKLKDLEDNLFDLEEGSLKDKYRFAKDYIEYLRRKM